MEYTMLLTNVEGVLTGQDGTTRWGAHRGNIVVLNDHSFAGKLINDWRLDGAVMEAHIIVAKVINQEEDKVRLLCNTGSLNIEESHQCQREDWQNDAECRGPHDVGCCSVVCDY